MRDKILALVSLMVSLVALVVSFYYMIFRVNQSLEIGMTAVLLIASALMVMLCSFNTYHTFHQDDQYDQDDDEV